MDDRGAQSEQERIGGRGLSYFWSADFIAICIRVIIISVSLLLSTLGIQIIIYQLSPMSSWVDYRSVELLPDETRTKEWVRVTRFVNETEQIVPVTRFVEVHEDLPGVGIINRCVSTMDVTTEFSENPVILWELDDYIGRCNLGRLEGRTVDVQVTYRLALPYGFSKKTGFRLGQFVIQNGILIAK